MLAARRETLSIYEEVRALAWIGVMLIATGVGILVTKHFAEIGPLTVAIVIGGAALGCYAWANWRKSHLTEYIVLLGALLISADVGFIEHQWHLLGSEWQRHFLMLAIVHAAAAYYFESRAVLSLSVAALAAWLGVERAPSTAAHAAIRSFAVAGVVALWRLANRKAMFNEVFEHFAANFAFWGALILSFSAQTRWAGVTITVVFAVVSIVYGFRVRREPFILYGYVYSYIAIVIAVSAAWRRDELQLGFILLTGVAVVTAMVVTHLRFRR